MNRFVPAMAALALFGLSAAAHAETADGVISGINPDTHTVTLEGGKTFHLATTGMLNDIKTGEHAMVTYEMKDGQMVASEIIAKPAR